jgi:hypothetical protein
MIHSTVLANFVTGPEILIVSGSVILNIVWTCFVILVALRILKMPTAKNLQTLTDSITAESQKNREAIEELTRAVQELKDK